MTSISRVAPDQYDAPHAGPVSPEADAPGAGAETAAEAVRRVTAEAARADGRSPLNEAALLSLRHHGLAGKALWVARDDRGTVTGFALAAPEDPRDSTAPEAGAPVEVNLVVAPSARGAGTGRALAQEVLATYPLSPVGAWSHGNHPAAARLATALGFEQVRDLWVMRRPLSPDHPLPEVPTGAGGTVVRTFRRGQDEEAFLAVNAEAFVNHPEQGAMDRVALEERMAEEWFDPEGFFVAEPADAPSGELADMVESPSLLGFHWTKVHDDRVGEVYVVGVSPAAQGRGLAKLLTLRGLHYLRDRGLAEVILYVEADNAPAIAVYSGLGFTHAAEDTDVRYARVRPAPA